MLGTAVPTEIASDSAIASADLNLIILKDLSSASKNELPFDSHTQQLQLLTRFEDQRIEVLSSIQPHLPKHGKIVLPAGYSFRSPMRD